MTTHADTPRIETTSSIRAAVEAHQVRDAAPLSTRRLTTFAGAAVLCLQLLFVIIFFPAYSDAAATLHARSADADSSLAASQPAESRYTHPDLLQWSGAQSIVWIAALFFPDTPVRYAPALVLFLVAGGFVAAMGRPPLPGRLSATVNAAARDGMRLWLSWLAGAAILLVYLLTSSGGMTALRTSAAITFQRPWADIADALLSHWLIYLAWFAILGGLPLVGGALLGLFRTRLLTRPVTEPEPSGKD